MLLALADSLERHVFPHIGSRPVSGVTSADVRRGRRHRRGGEARSTRVATRNGVIRAGLPVAAGVERLHWPAPVDGVPGPGPPCGRPRVRWLPRLRAGATPPTGDRFSTSIESLFTFSSGAERGSARRNASRVFAPPSHAVLLVPRVFM